MRERFSRIVYRRVTTLASKSPETPKPERKGAGGDSKNGESTAVSKCPSCTMATQPGAGFCHGCGASLDPRPAGRGRKAKMIALFGAVVLGIVAVGVAFLRDIEPDKDEMSMAPALFPTSPALFPTGSEGSSQPAGMPAGQPAGAGSGQPVDLSTRTPREAADRLFNRIMMASEQGDSGEALRFVPMALQAYGQLGTLDADARYHLGRIHAVTGDVDGVRKQIGILNRFAPNHLLAIILEHSVAEQVRDKDAAAQAIAAFVAAYDTESNAGRQEYADHRITIENFRKAAGESPVALAAPGLVGAAGEGAELFVKACAICHGRNASGSERGPPLVHRIYEPSHHGDDSFYRAAEQGVQAHHWSFGNMPPATGVSTQELAKIIAYVRALQVAIGIR